MREHAKAKYRVVVLGLVALLGPTAFYVSPGPFTAVFSALLVFYALWTLRLTAIFRDDDQLGLILTAIDAAIVIPLFVWGTPGWFAFPLIGFWLAGSGVSLQARKLQRCEDRRGQEAIIDRITGLLSGGLLAPAVGRRLEGRGMEGGSLGLVSIKVHRFNEIACYYGREAADHSLVAVSRRALRVVGEHAEGFRTGTDTVAFLVPACRPIEIAEVAMAVSAAANGRLVEGKKIECLVGYASAPRDGVTAEELLDRADLNAFGARLSQRTTVDTTTRSGAARARAAAG
jgi:predicted signal transduction protein with EAL and GGDEF domain